MATLQQLLTQYAAYNAQHGVGELGVRLPSGVQGPDGYVPCFQSPLGCNEIVGKTAIPGTVYWMPAQLQTSTPTVVIQPSVDVEAERERVRAALRAEAQRELTVLLGALDQSSAAYRAAHDAVDGAITPVLSAEIAGLDYNQDPSRFAQLQQIAIQHIDDAAVRAYQAWLETTHTATSQQAVDAASSQAAATAGAARDMGAPDAAGALQTAVTASGSVSSQIPGLDSALAWYRGVRDRFLNAPAELRADLARVDALRALAPATSPNIQGIAPLEDAFRNLLMDWPTMAVTGQQIDAEIASSSGTPGLATLARIVSLAGMVLNFFARKATAEAALDLLARGLLSPDAYAQWRTTPVAEESSGIPWAMLAVAGVGVYAASKVLGGSRRRGRK